MSHRKFLIGMLFAFVFPIVGTSLVGCGENPEQRKSGTLVTPLDSVEKAGEAAGKLEDAKKAPKK